MRELQSPEDMNSYTHCMCMQLLDAHIILYYDIMKPLQLHAPWTFITTTRLVYITAEMGQHLSPQVITHPQNARDIVPEENSNVSFTIHANGTDLKYCWQRKPLHGEEGTQKRWESLPKNSKKFQGVETSTLTIHSVHMSDEGEYRCAIFNASNSSKFTEPAVLTTGKISHNTSIYLLTSSAP